MENLTMVNENDTDMIETADVITNVGSKDMTNYIIVPVSIVLLVKKICYVGVVPFLALIGIVLNSLCFVMFVRLKNKTSTIVILLSLAVIDICILVNGAFNAVRIISMMYGGPLSVNQVKETVPYFSTYIYVIPGKIGNILTLMIAMERLLCVLMPLKIRQYSTKRTAVFAVILSCICTSMFCLPNLFLYTTDKVFSNATGEYQVILKQTEFGKRKDLTNAIFVTIEVVFRVVPVVGVAIASVITAVTVVINAKRRSTLTNISTRSRTTTNKERQVTKTLLTVTSVFVICQMPGTILIMIIFIDPDMTPYRYKNNIYELAYPIIYSLVMFNSVVNFIIYSMTNNTYKTQFKKLFGRMDVDNRTESTKSTQLKSASIHM